MLPKYIRFAVAFFMGLISTLHLHGQIIPELPADSIHYKSSFLSYKYIVHGNEMNFNEVLKTMKDSTPAYDTFKSANEAKVFGYIFSSLGLALIITPTIMSCFDNNKGWSMAYAGAGIAAVSIPLFIKHKRQVPKAIELHNNTVILNDNDRVSLDLRFGINPNGLGFCLRF